MLVPTLSRAESSLADVPMGVIGLNSSWLSCYRQCCNLIDESIRANWSQLGLGDPPLTLGRLSFGTRSDASKDSSVLGKDNLCTVA